MPHHKKTLLAGVIVLVGAIGFCGTVTIHMNRQIATAPQTQVLMPKTTPASAKQTLSASEKQTKSASAKQTLSAQAKQTSATYTVDQLSSAVLSNEKEQVKEILDSKQVNINSKDSEGQYPLENVLVFDNVELAAFLLENGADPHLEMEEGITIAKAVAKSNNEAMKALFKNY